MEGKEYTKEQMDFEDAHFGKLAAAQVGIVEKKFADRMVEKIQKIGLWTLLCFLMGSAFGVYVASKVYDNQLKSAVILGGMIVVDNEGKARPYEVRAYVVK